MKTTKDCGTANDHVKALDQQIADAQIRLFELQKLRSTTVDVHEIIINGMTADACESMALVIGLLMDDEVKFSDVLPVRNGSGDVDEDTRFGFTVRATFKGKKAERRKQSVLATISNLVEKVQLIF
jgi:hypothetical protein